jgi:hypothetical protein
MVATAGSRSSDQQGISVFRTASEKITSLLAFQCIRGIGISYFERLQTNC